MKYEVEVKAMPSCGGGTHRVKVDAQDKATALFQASLELDDQGIDRWELVRVSSLEN